MNDENSQRNAPSQLTRRQFLSHSAGGLTASLLLLKQTGSLAFAMHPGGEDAQLPPAKYELRFDEKLCAGCAYCEIACAQYHAGHADITACRNRFVLKPVLTFTGLSALSANAPGHPQALSTAHFAEFSENEFCHQCASPECLDACPENAITVSPQTGARLVNQSLCVGCGECVDACPYGMIHLDENTETAVKCDLCGGDPQCAAWCPTGAISYHKL